MFRPLTIGEILDATQAGKYIRVKSWPDKSYIFFLEGRYLDKEEGMLVMHSHSGLSFPTLHLDCVEYQILGGVELARDIALYHQGHDVKVPRASEVIPYWIMYGVKEVQEAYLEALEFVPDGFKSQVDKLKRQVKL